MKNIYTCFLALLLSACGREQSPVPTELPHLHRQGTAMQLIVEGKPFLMLGGELGNSTASALNELDSVFAHLQQLGLNTVLTPVYWELIEPQEGFFDFTSVNTAITAARAHELKLVLLWFGSWKNSMSCYAPLWLKEDFSRYPRARTKDGKPLEIMTAFDENNLSADRRAFVALMEHIARTDATEQTILMIQVENEIGMIPDARDYHPEATERFNSPVPQRLIAYLIAHEAVLHPVLCEHWEKYGKKTTGTWTELFGESPETDELFMAYHYGRYIEEIACAGKRAYPLPMYLNAALNSRGRKPGQYPSAGPLAHLIDVWRAAAPSIDLIAPDVYDAGFTDWCAQYHIAGNPLFIPEIRMSDANAVQALYAFGEHDAMGFSPFSIENVHTPPLAKSYDILRRITPYLTQAQGKGKTRGFLLDETNKESTSQLGNYLLTGRHLYTYGWSPQAKDGSPWPEAGALVIQLAGDEFLVAGTGIAITFANASGNASAGIGYIDKVTLANGEMTPVCRMNGDQSHQGRHLRIETGDWNIQHIRLYNYK
jgi:hypothetical protein